MNRRSFSALGSQDSGLGGRAEQRPGCAPIIARVRDAVRAVIDWFAEY